MKKIVVKNLEKKIRFDVFLVEQLSLSRSQIQKQIEQGTILLNEKISKIHTYLKEGDVISVETVKKVKQDTETLSLEILFEDEDFLVVNKPVGILVHPTQKKEKSLVDQLVKQFPKIKKVGENPLRPGIVHRLDKLVSGVLLVAKTQDGFDCAKKQFLDRTIEKKYSALVYGVVKPDHFFIEFPIVRSKRLGRMVALPQDKDEGKDAKTECDVVKRFTNTTLLNIQLHTGRTHQIRVHLKAFDHPIVGDTLYFKKHMKNIKRKTTSRIFLHATSIQFENLKGELIKVESKIPQEILDEMI